MVIMLFFLHPVHETDAAWCALLGAAFMMMYTTPHHIHSILDNVEWETLLFFGCLFVLVEGLAEMKLIRYIGGVLTTMVLRVHDPRTQLFVGMELVIWVSAFASAFVDNIPCEPRSILVSRLPLILVLTQ